MPVVEITHLDGQRNLAECEAFSVYRSERTGSLVVETHETDEDGEEITVGVFDSVLSVQGLPEDETEDDEGEPEDETEDDEGEPEAE